MSSVLPLALLLPPTRKEPVVSSSDVELAAGWTLDAGRTSLVALEGERAGRVVITARARPLREPGTLLDELWQATNTGTPTLRRLIATWTVDGEHAVLGVAESDAGAVWLGMVIGDDFMATVVGTCAADAGERLGRVVRAITLHLPLGLQAQRPRAYFHRAPTGWRAAVGAGGETTWRAFDGDAMITAYPALPLGRDSFSRWLDQRLFGCPLVEWERIARRSDVTAITTRHGASGYLLRGGEDGDVVALQDSMFRYLLTLRSRADDAAARRAFAELVDGLEPVPRPFVAPCLDIADHWTL